MKKMILKIKLKHAESMQKKNNDLKKEIKILKEKLEDSKITNYMLTDEITRKNGKVRVYSAKIYTIKKYIDRCRRTKGLTLEDVLEELKGMCDD